MSTYLRVTDSTLADAGHRTPWPGALFWHQAMCLLDLLTRGRRVVGADVVELAPVHGLTFADFTAAQLAHRLLSLMVP